MTTTTTPAVADQLLAPFPAEQIGKLPRLTCKDCSKSPNGSCADHAKQRCTDCGNYISPRHIHLDYVGHADVTRRLLEVDSSWTWEPLGADEHGMPLFDTDDHGNPVGLWIRLTVGGVSRLGYGSCPSNQNDAVKVLIGDALRNAAMRFGVAVDLWAKGDRTDPTTENATASPATATRRSAAPSSDPVSQARVEMLQVAKEQGYGSDPTRIGEMFTEAVGKPVQQASVDDIKKFVAHLRSDAAKKNGQAEAAAS